MGYCQAERTYSITCRTYGGSIKSKCMLFECALLRVRLHYSLTYAHNLGAASATSNPCKDAT